MLVRAILISEQQYNKRIDSGILLSDTVCPQPTPERRQIKLQTKTTNLKRTYYKYIIYIYIYDKITNK